MIFFFKLFKFIPNSKKIFTIIILTSILISTVLETFSLGLIIPLISTIVDNDLTKDLINTFSFLEFLNNYTQKELIIIFSITLILVFFIKNIFLLVLLYMQKKYCFEIQAFFAQKIFNKYANQDYNFFLQNQHSTSFLIRNISSETSQLNGIIFSLLVLIAEVFIVISLTLLMIIFSPIITIFSFITILLITLIYIFFTQKVLVRLGFLRQESEGSRIKIIQETFIGVINMILFNKRKFFMNKFEDPNNKVAIAGKWQQFFQGVPRIGLEFIAISGLTIIIIYFAYFLDNTNDLILTLSLFFAVFLRILPSASRILGCFQSLRYSQSVINLIIKNLDIKDKFIDKSIINDLFKNKIEFKNVNFFYNNNRNLVLENLNFSLMKNDTIGILGKSGVGKTTFINILIGLLSPKNGEIVIDDKYKLKNNLSSWYSIIGYVPQDSFVIEDTITRNVAFGVDELDINYNEIQKALKSVRLEEYINSLENSLDTLIGERGLNLSGGQKQRICIARAIYKKPKILVFDEATSSLDPKTEEELLNNIREISKNLTTVIISHKKNNLKGCDKIYEIKNKKLIYLSDKG